MERGGYRGGRGGRGRGRGDEHRGGHGRQSAGQGRARGGGGFDTASNSPQFQPAGRAPNAWGRGRATQQQHPEQQPPSIQQYVPRPQPQPQPPAWGLQPTTSLSAAVANLNISGPSGSAPRIAGPSGAAPQIAGPSGSAPQIPGPSGSAPQSSAPRSLAPQSTAPRGLAPQISVPSGVAPQSSAPSRGAGPIAGTSGALKPVSRPDSGGRNGCKQVRLIANHFKVAFAPTQQIFHYDVDMTLVEKDGGLKRGGGAKQKGRGGSSKTDFPARPEAVEIKNKLLQENKAAFGRAMPVYDGKKNLYSPIPLPEEIFHVKISKGEDSEVKEYKVCLKLANKLDGRKLVEFLSSSNGGNGSVQQELLQALDLVVREYPSQSRIIIGRSLYSKVPDRQGFLNGGAVATRGFSMSLRPTAQGLALNLDFSVVAFHQQMPVLDYLWENCKIDCQENKPLNPNERRLAERALRNLKVSVNHRRTKQKFTVARLTKQTTRELKFDVVENENQQRSQGLLEYFRQRYNKDIQFKLLPCLDLSKQSDRPNYVPMEFCTICEGQRFPKDNLNGFQTKNLLRLACPPARDRHRIIKEIMSNNDGPRGGPYLPHFQMTVGAEMTEVTARVLEAPQVRLGDRGQISHVTPRPDDRQWNLLKSHVFDGKQIDRWGIVYFAFNPERYNVQVENFCRSMVSRFRNLGINMVNNPMVSQPETMDKFDNAQQLRNTLNALHTKTRGQLQILFCVMEEKHSGYKNLKLICETEIGLVTQCCLLDHVKKCGDSKYGSQYLANLALKVNAKIGGSNAALVQGLSNQLPRFGSSHVVYFGADVNHPGKRDERSPSIAAVVMSINWPYLNRYVVKIRCQKNRQEYISELGDMSKELLEEYQKIHKRLPERIIFFRDGVSEGQFDIVLNQELVALKNAFKQLGGERYNPAISFIIAQKRHHTRLFPLGDVSTKSGNVPPGTVLDTVIVHPREFDFYLCSHYGLLGTSKPTHYHVLWDENAFTSDELQALINNLCYTFARCTKPVSLAPPVYYADLAAYRGRMYVEGLSSYSDTSSSASSSSGSSTCLAIPKINVGVENFMFFL